VEGRDAFRASRARPGIRRGISRAIEKTADRPATNKDCAFYAGISTCSAANAPRSHASPRFARPRSAVPCLESTADRFRIQLQAGAAYAAATRLCRGVRPHFRTGDLSTLQEFNHGPNDEDDTDDPQRKVRLREIVRGVGPHVAGSRDATTLGAPDFGRLAPNVYYLQGFSGHGIALTGMAGKLAAEAIAGQAERFDLFTRLEHRDFPGGPALRMPALVLAMLWFRLKDLL